MPSSDRFSSPAFPGHANLLRNVRVKTIEGASAAELDAAVKAFNELQQDAPFMDIQCFPMASGHVAYITYIPGTPE